MAEKIIILGGMGPQASLYFHQLIIDNAAENGAVNNADYPEIVHFSIPVRDFINSKDSKPALEMINRSLMHVRLSPHDKVFLTCNTAHLIQNEIESNNNLRIISLTQSVRNHLERKNTRDKKVGILASPTTVKSGLYSSIIDDLGYTPLTPGDSDLDSLEQIIRNVLANKKIELSQPVMHKIIKRLKSRGAERIIIGCTELSLILKDYQDESIIDPLKLLIEQNLNNTDDALQTNINRTKQNKFFAENQRKHSGEIGAVSHW